MISKINKKGDKLISVYWFAILVIVAVGVVLMVNAFYGNPYDVRQIESETLADHVANCIYYGGQVNPSLLSADGVFRPDFRDNFMHMCFLNFSVEGEFTPVPYYIEVNFSSGINDFKNVFGISEGNINLRPDCYISAGNMQNLAKCTQKEFFMKSSSGKVYAVKILSVVSKVTENTNG
jgi:hypothetical protein